jgi:bacterioferritin
LAKHIIVRIDGTPSMTELLHISIGKNVKEQLEGDLKLEIAAVEMYNSAVEVCRAEGDNASRELFERLLKDEEAHVDWLEAQVYQIKEIGYERYLTNKSGKKNSEAAQRALLTLGFENERGHNSGG